MTIAFKIMVVSFIVLIGLNQVKLDPWDTGYNDKMITITAIVMIICLASGFWWIFE